MKYLYFLIFAAALSCSQQNCQFEDCANGRDDDNDGFTDCSDPECYNESECQLDSEQYYCADEVDNDQDSFVDCRDYDCYGYVDCEGAYSTCDDGLDNDKDDYIDCDDSSCYANCNVAFLCLGENTIELCSDGIDNDYNGFPDCEDDACWYNSCVEVWKVCH